jgi:flagellar biosynthesis protein FlhF
MKIKRFQATDVKQAIREVREVLGPDAVILSNTRVDGGIEIVAATDYDESAFQRSTNTRQQSDTHETETKVEINPTYTPKQEKVAPVPAENIWSQEPTLVQMRREIAGLRDMLQHQLSDLTWKDMERQSPTQMQLLKRFLHMGVEVEMAKHITSQMRGLDDLETAWRQSLGRLAQNISLPTSDFLSDGGIYALVGPTGVGKTTTIAKLAARCALKHGARQVALITTDCYRIGAQEQLRNYARILGVPLRVARNYDELNDALNDVADRRFILIDTAGMNQRDMQLTEKFNLLKQTQHRVKTYLTLSATTQTSGMDDIIRAYAHVDPCGCILTKTDEASSLGGAISSVIRHHMPLAFVTNGQQVPEDLSAARPNVLVNQASELMSTEQTLDPQTLSSYGGFAAYG